MGMFGIGSGEIIIILIIALIIIGPNKLPELAKILGKGFAEFKRAADDIRDSVRTEIHIEEEKRKLLDIQHHQGANEHSGQTEQANSSHLESIEEKGNLIKDNEEKKDLL